jgi:hypothetical protein
MATLSWPSREATIADVSSLSLPSDVEGLAGLSFLRQFARWGAERSEVGRRFILSDEEPDVA